MSVYKHYGTGGTNTNRPESNRCTQFWLARTRHKQQNMCKPRFQGQRTTTIPSDLWQFCVLFCSWCHKIQSPSRPSLLGPPFKSFFVQKSHRVCQQKAQGHEHFLLHRFYSIQLCTFLRQGLLAFRKRNKPHGILVARTYLWVFFRFLKPRKPRLRNVNSCML